MVEELEDRILTTLRGADDGRSMNVKELRRLILISCQLDEKDKDGKKRFKKAVQSLETEGKLTLNQEGLVKLKKSEMKDRKKGKSDKKKKKKKKKSKEKKENEEEEEEEDDEKAEFDNDDDEEKLHKKKKLKTSHGKENTESTRANKDEEDGEGAEEEQSNKKKKSKPCTGNPNGITRLFLGNLPFAVDETSLRDFFSPGEVTHIKWITDKETGQFYGSAFIEVKTSKDGAIAMGKNGENLMGRPIRVNYAPAREGDVWPPKKNVVTGGGQAGGSGIKAMSEKPENCMKLFMGNLSYDIDDDGICKFFANVDAEVKAVRWLHHKDSGDFKGCGYVEFWNTEACEKAATLNGKVLLGRPIRIDWTD